MMRTSDNAGMLWQIFRWTEDEGEGKAVDRLKVMLLPQLVAERVWPNRITDETTCSEDLVRSAREAAARVVGRPCRI